MKRALIFGGQGTQRKGMCVTDILPFSKAASLLFDSCEDRMKSRYGISLMEVIRDDPPYLHCYESAVDFNGFYSNKKYVNNEILAAFLENKCESKGNATNSNTVKYNISNVYDDDETKNSRHSRTCTTQSEVSSPFRICDAVKEPAESRPRPVKLQGFHSGVLSLTQLAQPAVLVSELATLAAAEELYEQKQQHRETSSSSSSQLPFLTTGNIPTYSNFLRHIHYFCGHSLGEFSALAAMKVLPSPQIACELVFRRGVLMMQALQCCNNNYTDYFSVTNKRLIIEAAKTGNVGSLPSMLSGGGGGAWGSSGINEVVLYKMYAVNPTRAKLGIEELKVPDFEEAEETSKKTKSGEVEGATDATAVASDRESVVSSGARPIKTKCINVNPEDVLAYLVELISKKLQHTTSWLEIVNYNIAGEQVVVVGDDVGLSMLGKVIDPLFRANQVHINNIKDFEELVNCAAKCVQKDIIDNVCSGSNVSGFDRASYIDVNAKPPEDFVPASWKLYGRQELFKRQLLTMDDGQTQPIERLTSLTLEGEGRNGLKKKSWYLPLAAINVPFHSSVLRRAMDNFYPEVLDALPSSEYLESVFFGYDTSKRRKDGSIINASYPPRLLRKWITNLTGTLFDPYNDSFIDLYRECIRSANIGEQTHNGKYQSGLTELLLKTTEKPFNLKKIIAAVITAQLAHPVQWIDSMRTMIADIDQNTLGLPQGSLKAEVIEVSPNPTLNSMLKKELQRGRRCVGMDGVGEAERMLLEKGIEGGHDLGDTARFAGIKLINFPDDAAELMPK